MLSKLWKDSVLSVSHESDDVSRELNCLQASEETNERALVFRCVDLIGALHSSFDGSVLEREPYMAVDADASWQTKLSQVETMQKACCSHTGKDTGPVGLQRDAIEKLRSVGKSMRRGSLPEVYISSFMSRNYLVW
jgi:hypothetical protein